MGAFPGFGSSLSCLFQSAGMTIVKNYCNLKSAPARSLYIMSEKLGFVQLYEEKYTDGTIKRDYLQRTFAVDFIKHLKKPLAEHNLKELGEFYSRVYKAYEPACWATNMNLQNDVPDANCYREDISRFTYWSEKALPLVTDTESWDQYYLKIQP
jgi:hypothetical protein